MTAAARENHGHSLSAYVYDASKNVADIGNEGAPRREKRSLHLW